MNSRSNAQSDYHVEMNRIMVALVPELDTKWAATPMAFDRWRCPDENLDNGEPCFVACIETNPPAKEGYIYMPKRKDLPAGYYHLRTQEAYVEVYYRLRRQAPPLLSCFRGRNSPTTTRAEYRKVKTLIYNRVAADEPNDVLAAQLRLVRTTSVGGQAQAFGKAAYLPTLTTVFLLGSA